MQEKVKKGLGKGLDALLPPGPMDSRRILEIGITKLRPNKRQPREIMKDEAIDELVLSIREHGILQPILAHAVGDGNYEIIAGERRWRAAQKAGLSSVPVILKDIEEVEILEVALVENIQRENLNAIELAKAYKVFIDEFDYTQEELSKKVGKERATVANTLRLLTLPESCKKALYEELITVGHAKAILSAKHRDEQERILLEIIRKGLSVREAEKLASAKASPRPARREQKRDPNELAAEREMGKKLGMKVEIKRSGKGGSVSIHFGSDEELNHIYEWICYLDRRKK
ncbi:MAG TPA: ParB/RepB/Spo0J family partition protein [Acidobacteriota bacterium]|nr:ParB/RepB/Spo0J family partition protein [Acidobacteriota bacterium]HQQ47776.1 ParB/RepB/Spo0J family partition protein [Acidobacteriota bacterium]